MVQLTEPLMRNDTKSRGFEIAYARCTQISQTRVNYFREAYKLEYFLLLTTFNLIITLYYFTFNF